MSSDVVAAAVAATVLWVVSVGAFLAESPKDRQVRRGSLRLLIRSPVGPCWCAPTCRSRRQPVANLTRVRGGSSRNSYDEHGSPRRAFAAMLSTRDFASPDPCSTILVSTPEQSKLPTGIRPGEGVADPRYLLAEVTELRDIAERAGLGRWLMRLNARGWICVWLVEQQEQAERRLMSLGQLRHPA